MRPLLRWLVGLAFLLACTWLGDLVGQAAAVPREAPRGVVDLSDFNVVGWLLGCLALYLHERRRT